MVLSRPVTRTAEPLEGVVVESPAGPAHALSTGSAVVSGVTLRTVDPQAPAAAVSEGR